MTKLLLLLACGSAALFAELTPDQKVVEFRQLAGLYSKNYGPYEWKRDTQNFDLLQLTPWIEKVRATKTDLDFADVMMDYVASLNDGHDLLTMRSGYSAFLGFFVDFYNGKPLIDQLSRTLLPRNAYPFEVGDELISVDGVGVEEMTRKYWKYAIAANDKATRRFAAEFFTFRPQYAIPRAHEIGDDATVVIRRAATGTTDTYTIKWQKSGTPVLSFGTLPQPSTAEFAGKPISEARRIWNQMKMLKASRKSLHTVAGYDAVPPVFAMPAGFVQRLGRSGLDSFYSGTFTANGLRLGYLRIPDFDPASPGFAVSQFTSEIAFLEANTDGLIVDIMRNPGGSVDYCNFLFSGLMPYPHQVTGFEIRATSSWVSYFSQLLAESIDAEDPDWVTETYRVLLRETQSANAQNRGRTKPVALDSGPDYEATLDRPPLRNSRGVNIAYTKPIVLLVDETTASGGDAFASMMQDNKRGILFGYRTMGLGGNVVGWTLDGYAEVDTRITTSLMSRKAPVFTGGEYPVTNYVENVGVHPDIVNDYMTEDNLRNRGKAFVDAFTQAITDYIRILRSTGGEK